MFFKIFEHSALWLKRAGDFAKKCFLLEIINLRDWNHKVEYSITLIIE